MNKVFSEVAALQRCGVIGGPLTHAQRVTRLYRQSLRVLNSWSIERDDWCMEAEKIRAQFDAIKTKDAGVSALVAGEKKLAEYAHPDPYVVAYMPGGTKFMRNPTPAPEIQYPYGDIPREAYTGTNTPMWPDSIPISWRPSMKPWLINSMTKSME